MRSKGSAGFIRHWFRDPGRISPHWPCSVTLMEVSETVQCPYCGQRIELTIDTSIPTQRFTTDCEVCCRPFEVSVECEPGEVTAIQLE